MLVSTTALALLAGALYAFSGPVAGAAEAAVPQASATAAATTTEITLSEPNSDTPRATRPLVAGGTGFLQRQWAVDGLLWTDYADGGTVTVENASGVYTPVSGCTSLGSACHASWYGSDSDLVALPTSLNTSSVTLWDPGTRKRLVVSSGTGAKYRGLAGDTIVTDSTLIDVVDGKRYERTVTGDATNIQNYQIVGADSSGVLWARDGDVYYIDLATAVNTQVFTDVPSTAHFVQTDDRIGWSTADATGLHLRSRADLAAPEETFTLPYLAVPDLFQPIAGDPVLVGDWLLLPATKRTGGATLEAASLTDGSTRTLLTSAGDHSIQASGNDAFVTGGTGPADWWVQRVSQGEDGSLQLTRTYRIPAMENPKTGLALSRGSLRVVADNPESTTDTTSVRTLTTDNGTTLTASAATKGNGALPACPYPATTCAAMFGNSGEDVYLQKVSGRDLLIAMNDGQGNDTLSFGTAGGAIVDASDGYVLYNSGGTTPTQYVGEFGRGQKLKRAIVAAALNGPMLWSATATSGRLTSYSLTGNKTLATVTVPGLGCVPSELQAAGRWVYWACGTDSAGVYDTASRTSTAVQPGDVLLGDGFTVRHDHTTDELVLTETRTGTTRVLASRVPDTGLAADRRYRWTVDEYTGLVAWSDSYEQTHVASTGVAPSNPGTFSSRADAESVPKTSPLWSGDWLLSRPVTSWSLTFTSKQSGPTGRTTRTVTGGAATAWISATWNGLTANGGYFPNGDFTWTLRATGLGTSTSNTAATGTGYVMGGAPVHHDFISKVGRAGAGDLLTLTSSGALTFHPGTGTGGFSGNRTTGGGWPTGIKAIPFGHLGGSKCNDVLVRMANGALRLYTPSCNSPVLPNTSHTTLATSGWTQHDILTSPGDLTGDGRPDLIARKASTGAVYLYKGTSAGKLSGAVALYADWKGYKKIVGAGDLDGDGIGDLLAQDKADNLYRFNGTGRGTFTARTKLFGSWGASYNAVVGVGDITNDGKADLVARDTAGNLYRQSGDGKGSFGARTKIGSGWGTYKSVS
ncbi:FG-GAP repeat domain-containing protein [Streptomyces sp. NPDC002680]|uniref:FG-GAP repeat domain-containing protein n=1 Tax=Streptomyces sp. NPDC002680 TaxID=3364659 RepID=UPI0036A36792